LIDVLFKKLGINTWKNAPFRQILTLTSPSSSGLPSGWSRGQKLVATDGGILEKLELALRNRE